MMTAFKQKLKFALVGITQSPLNTLFELGRRLFPTAKAHTQVLKLQKITQETPLILQIETVNICNAACVFCGYTSMKRKKGSMSMPLFEKVVKDYADMGGGPVSLTPVGGDALLDPHLLDRIKILEAHPKINQITLTTNAIALERFSDEDVCYLLTALDCIQVSIGGLAPETYKTMYSIDAFDKVQRQMERLVRLQGAVRQPASLTFAFRTNDWKFEIRFIRKLKEYRRRGVFISHIWLYANYSGMVKNDLNRGLMVMDRTSKQDTCCLYGTISMAVCWDGRITACGCADVEGNKLSLGNAETESLSEVWSGEKRAGILDSFKKGRPAKICRYCSAYLPVNVVFSRPYFKNFELHQPLPLDFFRQFWGG
jgi:MoaA/NifB/PqqE/SkfB family radical SAM enzyme